MRYNYRLYPTAGQRQVLARAFGCARVVFNDAVAARREAWADGQRKVSDAELSKRLTEVKSTPERAWLSEVSSVHQERQVRGHPWREAAVAEGR